MTRPKLYPSHQHQWAGVHERDCALNGEDLVSLLSTNFTPPPRCDCTPQAECTVCGFTAPRNLAGLDGQPDIRDLIERGSLGTPEAKALRAQADPEQVARILARAKELERIHSGLPTTDVRCTHQDAAGQCLDHHGHAGDHQHPAQETRADA